MTKWKTKIELPDDSYLPPNIDLKDTYFSTYEEAQNHVMDQKDILINWMRNDESCNQPLVIQSEKYDCYPNGGSCYTVVLDEECKCKFKVIKEESGMSFTKYLVTYYEYDQDGNCKDGPKIFKEAFNSEKEAKNAIMEDMNLYKNSMKEVDVDMIIDGLHIHDKDFQNGCIFNCIEINIDCGESTCSIH